MSDWTPGIPDEPTTAEVRPTRPIYLEFKDGQRECWKLGEVRLVRFRKHDKFGVFGTFHMSGVDRSNVIVNGDSPVEWRPIQIPETM